MTKDGRPSRLSDIRLFAGVTHQYLDGFSDVVAFAQRLAWFLNSENFSIGAHTHMYVFFSRSTPIGKTSVSIEGGDWWFKYTHVGAPRELTRTPETVRLLEEGVVAALKANRPDQAGLIDEAVAQVRTHGGGLRFLLKVKELRVFRFEAAVTIGDWKVEPTRLHVLRTDKQTGALADGPPFVVIGAEDARAHLAQALKTPPQDYQAVSARPPTSKLIKWMGVVDAA